MRRPPPKEDCYRPMVELLRVHAERAPDQPCLHSIDQGASLSWGQLYRLTNRLAAFLREKGIAANDRIAVLTDNSLENVVLYYGIQRYGATFCTVNVEINARHLREMLARLEPRLVLWHDALDAEALGAGAPGEWISFGECDPDSADARDGGLFSLLNAYPESPEVSPVNGKDDACCICFTSGTSDTPKGVIHSFGNYHMIGEQTAYLWGLTGEDRVLEYRSFSWSSAHQIVLHPLLIGGGTLLFARKFSQSRFFDWIRELKPSCAIGIPTVVNMLLDRPVDVSDRDLSSLRFMSCSTAPLMPHRHEAFERRYGIKLIQHYGMSEGGTVAGNHYAGRRIGSVGKPGIFQDLKIVDEGGRALPTGEIGEIEVGGPQNANAYLNPDRTIEPVRGKRLRTGDLGYLDADGYLYVTGRAKDLIIRGGVNIAPLEIDAAVSSHRDISEAATIGVPDPIYGEALVTYVVPAASAAPTVADVARHCAEVLPEFKRPQEIVITDRLEFNARGKIDRNALKARWQRDRS